MSQLVELGKALESLQGLFPMIERDVINLIFEEAGHDLQRAIGYLTELQSAQTDPYEKASAGATPGVAGNNKPHPESSLSQQPQPQGPVFSAPFYIPPPPQPAAQQAPSGQPPIFSTAASSPQPQSQPQQPQPFGNLGALSAFLTPEQQQGLQNLQNWMNWWQQNNPNAGRGMSMGMGMGMKMGMAQPQAAFAGAGQGRGIGVGRGWLVQQTQAENQGRGHGIFQNLARTFAQPINELVANEAPTAALTFEQKQHFFEQGYVVISDGCPKQLCDMAVARINKSIGKGFASEQIALFRHLTWAPGTSVITDLFYKSKAYNLVRSLVGQFLPVWGGQIALRFPGDGCIDTDKIRNPFLQKLLGFGGPEPFKPIPKWEEHWHIDGLPNFKNGVPPGEARNFTLLVGVALRDVPDNWSGNLTVFPGSHRIIEQYFRQNGGAKNALMQQPPLPRERLAQLGVNSPHQLLTRTGDIVLCHYQLAHAIAPNMSPNIRYMVYFRVSHVNHPYFQFRPESMDNIWLDFDGMRDFVSGQYYLSK